MNSRLIRFLLITCFIEGGTLLSMEILGSKIIAPWYGNTIYVWSGIIGTTLIALACGYFIGGKLSRPKVKPTMLFTILFCTSITIALLILYQKPLLNASLIINLKLAVALVSFAILFPTIVLFGTISPLAIHFISQLDKDQSRRAPGLVYAISTLGGIAGVLLTAFVIMPYLGIQFCLIFFALLLAVTAIIGFFRFRNTQ